MVAAPRADRRAAARARSDRRDGARRVLHTGLGPATRIDEAVIAWPSGAETRLEALAANRRYVVVEGSGVVARAPGD